MGALPSEARARASEGGTRRAASARAATGESPRPCVAVPAGAASLGASVAGGGRGSGAASLLRPAEAEASGTAASDGSDGCCACGNTEPVSDGGSLRFRGEPVVDMARGQTSGQEHGTQAGPRW
mmetsp:Transcript_7388/g.29540  ORF Transcript_7388/g.29540 Transcript_7388/m.29540 type:complete len:124 (+) Transcript_7388:868-1239(+)